MHGKASVVADAVVDELPTVVAPAGWQLGRLRAIGGSSLVYACTAPGRPPAVLKWGRWRERDVYERFAHEAAILRALGAPRTPSFLAIGAADEWPWMMMEELLGDTLATWMARNGDRGALGEIVAILQRLASALDAIHTAGYVHCDLKPENLVIAAHDARLLDFGLAVSERDRITQLGTVRGTVHYLAPEQLRTGAAIDRRTDIYSFGVIAFEMIAGVPPFVGERRAIEYQHQVVRPPPLRELRAIPEELEALVLGCLAKPPEARPQTAAAVHADLVRASSYIQTLKGIGAPPKRAIGATEKVVLAWIEGGDPVSVSRAIADVHGIIVRSRPGSMLVAFPAQYHDAPLAVAVTACRPLAHDRCRVVLHASSALVRRTSHGKPAFYGPEIEQPARWTPAVPFTGLLLTAAAAELAATTSTPVPELPGFFRDAERDRTDATDAMREPRLVGRDRILQEVGAIAGAGGMVIAISGGEGAGKTRVLAALAERLRGTKREVIQVRVRRRLLGDRSDGDRLVAALGGGPDLGAALANAAHRRAIVLVDDAHHLSMAERAALLRDDVAVMRVLTSRTPLFEVPAGVTKRLAIELPSLSYPDAERLLRDLLEPARLVPDVLLQRLALRGAGNAGLLVALARDIKHRGGIRREAGSNDWYVATDEIDTLLAAPSAAWLASRALEALAVELAPVVRLAAALGPTFTADELAAATELSDIAERLPWLVREGVVHEVPRGFELADPSVQQAIYDHVLDERSLVHARLVRHLLVHRQPGELSWLARIAYHAAGAEQRELATAAGSLLARAARTRGEDDQAAAIEARYVTERVSDAALQSLA